VVAGLGKALEAQSSLLIALLATALVAVLFQPLRQYLQGRVDRLIYGERGDPYQVLARLGQRLEGALDPEATLPVIVETVAGALKLPYVAITLHQESGAPIRVDSGVPPAPADVLVNIPLTYQGLVVGELEVAPRPGESSLSPPDRRLLGDLALQAGVAIHAVQVTAELHRARERLVSAREEERRRLRRDLHDGLGPRLASQTLTLDVIAHLMHTDLKEADALIHVLSLQTQQSVSEIRELINGLRPPALDDLGLGNAIQELACEFIQAGADPHIDVRIDADLRDLPAAIEVAIYRIVQEALTNVIKHAGASECWVQLRVAPKSGAPVDIGGSPPVMLVLDVIDNGRGITNHDVPRVGLGSMNERAAEVGGRLTIEPVPGGGTRVRAELPLPRQGAAST
jgi:signal transduction histidine kinase